MHKLMLIELLLENLNEVFYDLIVKKEIHFANNLLNSCLFIVLVTKGNVSI